MAVTAWKYPSSAAATSMTGDGSGIWSNPENVGADDASNATVTLNTTAAGQSKVLRAYGFGFDADIPAGSIIVGVEVEIQRSAGSATRICDLSAYLVTDGTAASPASRIGSNRATATPYTTSMANETHGGAADLWDATLTAAIVRDPKFGLHFQAQYYSGTAGSVTASFDYVAMRITFIPPAQGTAAIVEGADTSTAAGTVKVQGAAAITEPADAVTSTAGYSPILDLDFTGGALPGGIVMSGAANGTRINAAGVLVAATAPRFDYDPVTLASRGLLTEDQRTNLLLRSSDYSTAWGALTGITLTAGQASPDGASNATKVECTTTGATRILTQTVTTTTSTVYVFSAYVKKNTTNYCVMAVTDGAASNQALWTFDLNAGATAQNLITSIASTAGVQDAGNGWYRCWVQITAPGTSVQTRVFPTSGPNTANGSTGDSIFLFGAQLEAGSFLTSYIPTSASAVTRTADQSQAAMMGTDFSNWYNQGEGTFVADFDIHPGAGTPTAVAFAADANGPGDGKLLYKSSGGSALQALNDVVAASLGTVSYGVLIKASVAYTATTSAGSMNGGAVGSATGSPTTVPDRLWIGRNYFGNRLNGHIRRLRYYNQRLPNTVLQALTKTISGAAAIAEANDNIAATGRVKVQGTGAIVEGGDVAAGAGETGIPLHTPSRRSATVGISRLANRTAR